MRVSAAVLFGVRHIFTREAAMLHEERLESQDVFGLLRPEQVDILSNAADVMEYKTGDTVYFHGEKADHMYAVLDGSVLLRLPGRGGISVPMLRHRHLLDHGRVHAGLEADENRGRSASARDG
jgi:hypothetical protein